MNDIDILEEFIKRGKTSNNDVKIYSIMSERELNALSNLISENKELKEKNKDLTEDFKGYTRKVINAVFQEDYISKSKVEEVIEEVKEDENPSISSFQEYAQEYAIDKLQSLLGKENKNE